MYKYKLSIIVPIYNEINTLDKVLQSLLNLNIKAQFILIDDGSTDGSYELIQNKYHNDNIIKLYNDRNYGKGYSIRNAIKYIEGEYSVIQDADMEYDPSSFYEMLEVIETKKSDAVYGTRFTKRPEKMKLAFYIGNKIISALARWLYKINLTDIETCYKMLRTDVLKQMNLRNNGFDIEPEITAELVLKNYNIIEIPIKYNGRNSYDGKKIKWYDFFPTIWTLIKKKYE